jgi:hypothetical protein
LGVKIDGQRQEGADGDEIGGGQFHGFICRGRP